MEGEAGAAKPGGARNTRKEPGAAGVTQGVHKQVGAQILLPFRSGMRSSFNPLNCAMRF